MKLKGDRQIREIEEDGQNIVYALIRIPRSPMTQRVAVEWQFEAAKREVLEVLGK